MKLINGVNFNDAWAKGIGEQEFVDTLLPVAIWPDVPDREVKLRKAWRLINDLPEEEIAALDEGPSQENKPTPRKRETKKVRGE